MNLFVQEVAMPFTDTPWENPQSRLNTNDYCAVCLIDLNPSGQPKIKANCKLPVRSTPGGAYNRNALRAAAAALAGARGGVQAPANAKRKAARKLVRLMREAGITVGESLLRIAGRR